VAATRPRWEVRREIGLDESHKIALFVGRIHNEQKNPQLLIDAVDLLGHEWRAVLLGPIFDRPKFSSKSIHLCPDWNVANILNAADMLVHPARHESHGLAINEAWLARRPVVSCAYPVNRLFHSKHGEMMKLVPVDASPQQLADAMEQVGFHAVRNVGHVISLAHRVASRSYTAHKMGCAWSDFLAGLF
jgi:glycosyltransferase involved in cell wall biosynthesis